MLLGCFCALPALADFTEGNLLVVISQDVPTASEVHEYTPSGEFVQSLIVPLNPGGVAEFGRDLILDDAGLLHVFNGTFDPLLSSFDGVMWEGHTLAEWSTVNNVSYGGIAATAQFVYVTDMTTSGDPAKGIVRFDTSIGGYPATRFAPASDYIDLNIGLDCLLYGLRNEFVIDVFDPLTMSSMGTINLENAVRGVAVASNGDIFGASWTGTIRHFDPTGTELNFVDTGSNNLTDINLDRDGNLVVGSRFGDVIQTTTALTTPTLFNITTKPVFVAHVSGDQCTNVIFEDGFESGDTSAWSNTVP